MNKINSDENFLVFLFIDNEFLSVKKPIYLAGFYSQRNNIKEGSVKDIDQNDNRRKIKKTG